jgi:hypothetical protein
MSNTTQAAKIEELELNRETIQDLTEQEGEQARGGLRGAGLSDNPVGCARAGGAARKPSNDPLACG